MSHFAGGRRSTAALAWCWRNGLRWNATLPDSWEAGSRVHPTLRRLYAPEHNAHSNKERDAHTERKQIGVVDADLKILVFHQRADDFFLNYRTDAANAIDNAGDGNPVAFSGDLHGRRAAQQRVGTVNHEADQSEIEREGVRAGAEFHDEQITRDHAQSHE